MNPKLTAGCSGFAFCAERVIVGSRELREKILSSGLCVRERVMMAAQSAAKSAKPQARRGRRAVGRSNRARNVTVNAKKVAVLGASGGIGQPLSMLLMMNPLVRVATLMYSFPPLAAHVVHTRAQRRALSLRRRRCIIAWVVDKCTCAHWCAEYVEDTTVDTSVCAN